MRARGGHNAGVFAKHACHPFTKPQVSVTFAPAGQRRTESGKKRSGCYAGSSAKHGCHPFTKKELDDENDNKRENLEEGR